MDFESNESTLQWKDIDSRLDDLRPTEGGFSDATRGLVTLENGKEVFVKLGTNEASKENARKELAAYQFLAAHGYTHIPTVQAVSTEGTGFVIDALSKEGGWNWNNEWTEVRLESTYTAMDELAALTAAAKEQQLFQEATIDQSYSGWKTLRENTDLQKALLEKLTATGKQELASHIDFLQDYEKSMAYVFKQDTLVHGDVRADNCPWHAGSNQVKLVDWNWLHCGDGGIADAEILTHVARSGFTLPDFAIERINPAAMHWLAGYWFASAATPIWNGGPAHLRDFQLESGITALNLAILHT